MKVAVVILNWNGKEWLEQFLPGVVEHSQQEAEVIVADNASTDDSLAFLKEHFPDVRIVQHEENGGYAKGYNDALRQIEANIFVLLNSDVEVTPNWLQPTLQAMQKDPDIAACQPKILSYQEKDRFEYAGAAGGFMDKDLYPFCRGRIFNAYEQDNGQYDDPTEIFWASGACLFIRSDRFWEAGGLDEDFFAHMEEIDLCWRIKNLGHKVLCCPSSTVYHVGGGTLADIHPRKTFLNFRNNLYLITKNYHAGPLFPKLMKRMVMDAAAGLKFLMEGKAAHTWAVIRSHFSFYRHFRKMLRKRKQVPPINKSLSLTGLYQGSIVWDHFFRKVHSFSDLPTNRFISN